MARIAIAGFMHETNTFAPVLTTYEHFEQAEGFPGLTQGSDMLSVFPPANIATGGFIKQAQALGHDIAPVLWCAAVPAGYVTEDAYERIVAMIIDGLVAERTQAKKDKNFARADEIRDQLKDAGIQLEDTREGTRWTRG